MPDLVPTSTANGRWQLWGSQMSSSFDVGEPVGDYLAVSW